MSAHFVYTVSFSLMQKTLLFSTTSTQEECKIKKFNLINCHLTCIHQESLVIPKMVREPAGLHLQIVIDLLLQQTILIK